MTQPFDPRTRKYSDFAAPFDSFWARWELTANLLIDRVEGYSYPVVLGVDLSRHNADPIDFDQVYSAGYRFVIFKASEGSSYRDPQFEARWPRAYGANLRLMAYHFFRDGAGGAIQAENFLSAIDGMYQAVNRNTRVWLDVEAFDGITVTTRRVRISDFLTMVHPLGGVYSSPYLWQVLTNNMPLPEGAAGWVAHWTSADQPIIPGGWTRAGTRLWQIGIAGSHSWVPAVPGVPGRCDVNIFFGDLAALDEWLGDQNPPPPPQGSLEERVIDLEQWKWTVEDRLVVLEDRTLAQGGAIMGLDERVKVLEENTPAPTPPLPEPADYREFVITADRANARFIHSFNVKKRYPIMQIYPSDSAPVSERIQFARGEVLRVQPDKVDTDGSMDYYRLCDRQSPEGDDLYLREVDGGVVS